MEALQGGQVWGRRPEGGLEREREIREIERESWKRKKERSELGMAVGWLPTGLGRRRHHRRGVATWALGERGESRG